MGECSLSVHTERPINQLWFWVPHTSVITIWESKRECCKERKNNIVISRKKKVMFFKLPFSIRTCECSHTALFWWFFSPELSITNMITFLATIRKKTYTFIDKRNPGNVLLKSVLKLAYLFSCERFLSHPVFLLFVCEF